MIIEIHAIQSFPPSNLNRDRAGHPKEAIFGGVRRARISSQSIKRSIRVSPIFANTLGQPIGIRTKRLAPHVVEQLAREGIDEEWAEPWAKKTVDKLYTKEDSKAKRAKQLAKERAKKRNGENAESDDEDGEAPLYVSAAEAQAIVRFLSEAHANDADPDIQSFCKAQVKALKGQTEALDIALCGRMLAGRPELNIEAACQVAHAISTHEVNIPQSDFFTAVDDLLPAETRGAAMMDDTYFNSATYYSYTRIHWEQLLRYCAGDSDHVRQGVKAFMRGFALVVPSGKKNAFVNEHRPAFLLAVARPNNDGQSLANAFERPVRASNGNGFVEPSIRALCERWDETEACWSECAPVIAVLNPHGYDLPSKALARAQVQNLSEWIEAMASLLGED